MEKDSFELVSGRDMQALHTRVHRDAVTAQPRLLLDAKPHTITFG